MITTISGTLTKFLTVTELPPTTTTTAVPALTTTFTPPSYCLNDIWVVSYTQDPNFTCFSSSTALPCNYLHLGPPSDTSCFPPGYILTTTAWFSPGLCPSGYTQACSNEVMSGTVTETQATCCPSMYACQTGNNYPWNTTNQCSYALRTTSTFPWTSLDGISLVTMTSTTNNILFNAYGVSVRYQSTDFVSTTSTVSTGPLSITRSTTYKSGSASSSAAVTPFDNATDSSAGLSVGAKSGIGFGTAVGVLALIGSGWYFFRRRRRQSSTAQYEAAPPSSAPAPHEKSDAGDNNTIPLAELDGNPRHEAYTDFPEQSQTQSHSGLQEVFELGTDRD